MKSNVSFNSTLAKFGIGLFETIKITNHPIDLDLHIDRMFNSAKELNVNIDNDKEFYRQKILSYIKENKISNKALRLTVFDEGYNISIRDISYDVNSYKKGFSLCLSPITRGNSIIYKHKTTNYFESIYSKNYANNLGYDDAIFLDSNKNILECSMSNIFFIKDDIIYTPKKTSPLLNGIMKLKVEKICLQLDIKLQEKDINILEIDKFESVFVTNSLMGVMPISNIQKHTYNKNHYLINKISHEL